MNILLINHYAGSKIHGMEYRPFYMAREWMAMGHRVTIVAASHSHLRSVPPELSGDFTPASIENIPYIWLKTPGYKGNGIRRSLNMFSFVRKLIQYEDRLVREVGPDLVIASSTYPLDMVAARRIARKAVARLVFEVHDLWPLTLTEMGMPKWHPFVVLMQWAEHFAYRNADRVISILPNAACHMESHGLRPDKFRHVPNGIVTAEWESDRAPVPREHAEVLAALREEGRFLVAYAGAHGLANALNTVVDAAALLREHPASFVLVGQGSQKEALHRKALALDLKNIVFLPPVPKASIPSLLSSMDVLLIGLKRTPLFRFGISPNKLMDYMMAGKPIIQAIEAGNDMVAGTECGLSVPPQEPQAIAEATLRLLALSPSEREAMGLRGREYVLAHHDYRILAQLFLEAVR